ncbi:MAG: ribosomal-protein-alanine N-acetyltransferase [Betaproteobacteria bacterium]|nr:ribosomal-protein-alanine N-acetyltransferase [Betaproteobacteria bacterium]
MKEGWAASPAKSNGLGWPASGSASVLVTEPMRVDHLPQVLHLEQSAYSHPWTRGNFIDSIASGYHMPVWLLGDELACYLVAMRGVDEVHLLNLTVAPAFQRQGLARLMLQALLDWARSRNARMIWLEVRASNQRAISLYRAHGFVPAGLRKNYYPLNLVQREDAVVMGLQC